MIELINTNIDFFLTLTPIYMSYALADYNVYSYIMILLLCLLMIIISIIDGKGKIIVNIFKENNPRLAYTKFDNHRLVDFFLKQK